MVLFVPVPFHFQNNQLANETTLTPTVCLLLLVLKVPTLLLTERRIPLKVFHGVKGIIRVHYISGKIFKYFTRLFVMNSEAPIVLKFTKLSEHAFPPVKGSEKAAGFDLKSAYDYVVPARGKELVKTDLQIELPHGCYGRVAPRSGLAVKNFIDVGAGVIDEDYRGNVGVVIFNHSGIEFPIKKGDRIAQLICERIYYPVLQEVTNLTETNRGEGGFGSTGTK